MTLISLLPLKKSVNTEVLTYFTGLELSPGDIVEAPLRSRTIQAIVIDVQNVEDAKSEIKNSSFTLRKVEKVVSRGEILKKPILRSAERLSDLYAVGLSQTLGALLNPTSIPLLDKAHSVTLSTPKGNFEKKAIQGDDDERIGSYKSLIRQSFARKESVFFIIPTLLDAEFLREKLEKGIEEYTVILHSGITSKKAIDEAEKKLLDTGHPMLFIATPTFLPLLRKDVSNIIVERANSRNYKTMARPYLDYRKLAEIFAEEAGLPITYGDITLPLEILSRVYDGEIQRGEPMRSRVFSNSSAKVINMTERKAEVLGPEVLELIKNTKENSEHIILFTGRKGLFPQTICGDCGTPVKCSKCTKPLVLYQTPNRKESFFYMCNHCGNRETSETRCVKCNSWKLITLGIGADLVEREVTAKFPDMKIWRLDADNTPKEKDAKKVIHDFMKSPGSLLIATEMALRFLKEKVENTAVISFDSIIALPEFRSTERLFYILSTIRTRTNREMLVQTRNPEFDAFKHFPMGNILEFSREELSIRQSTEYPPYTTIIKVTVKGTRESVIEEMSKIRELVHELDFDVFPSFTYSPKGEFILHAVARVSSKDWPHNSPMNTVLAKLKALPPWVEVRIDPDSLL